MRDAKIDLDWADSTYTFRLAWGQIAELQEKTDAGPYVVLNRLHNGQWRVEDISNVLRLGLIGGGMSPAEALKKVRTYVEARPPLESLIHAQAVLAAGLMGAPEETVGEREAASLEVVSTSSPTGSLDLPPSTEQVP